MIDRVFMDGAAAVSIVASLAAAGMAFWLLQARNKRIVKRKHHLDRLRSE
jgi:hypothetical protein